MPIVKCEYCGKEVEKRFCDLKNYKHQFCSKKCSQLARKKREIIKCDVCGKNIERKLSRINKNKNYCSKECYEKDIDNKRFKVNCKNCGKEIIRLKYSVDNFKNLFCSKECFNKFLNTNEYIINGDITTIIINSKKYGQLKVLIDTKNIDKVNKFCWNVQKSRGTDNLYVKTTVEKPQKHTLMLHRLIMNCPNNMVIDHINHNTLDNREYNLKIVTHKQNNENLKGAKRSNKSTGVRNVSFNNGLYRVLLSDYGKRINCGGYKTLEESENVAKQARTKYYTNSYEFEGYR